MRTIEEKFGSKARLVGDIDEFIDALEFPLENEDDKFASLCITLQEGGARTRQMYGTIHETAKLPLDKETRDCIVDALKGRLETLKKEIKGLI